MNPIPKTKIIRLKGQKLAKLNERIHQRDQHKCIYCGNRVDPGEKFHLIAGIPPFNKKQLKASISLNTLMAPMTLVLLN